MALCADNTFRIRVKCSPCEDDPPDDDDCCAACCEDGPVARRLCLTLSNINLDGTSFSDPSLKTLWEDAFEGAHAILTYGQAPLDGPPGVTCCANLTGSRFEQWSGVVTTRIACTYGYLTQLWNVILICCGGTGEWVVGLSTAYPITMDPTCSSMSDPVFPLGFAMCSDNAACPTPGSMVADCAASEFTGTIVGACPSDTDTMDFSIVPLSGDEICGEIDIGTDACCEDELGAGPDLSLVLPDNPECPAFGGPFTMTFGNYATPDYTLNDVWYVEVVDPGCPGTEGRTYFIAISCEVPNLWTMVSGHYLPATPGSTSETVDTATGVCNPFSVVFPGGTTVTL